MVKRILSVIKTDTPYKINANMKLDKNLKIPEDVEIIEDEVDKTISYG